MKIAKRTPSLIAALVVALAQLSSPSRAQNANAVADSWTPAHTADGQPDLQGIWRAAIGGTYSLTNPRTGGSRATELLAIKQGRQPVRRQSRIVDPPDGKVPYLPWAALKQQDVEAHMDTPDEPEYIDPQARCLPDGPIRSTFWTEFQILQFPGEVVFIYDQNHPYRVVPLDGRPHLDAGIKLWMGDSRGHWEGNTLVVDVTNNNSKSRLSNEGDFASDALHIVERYTFVDADTIDYEATLDDPSVYSRPWKIASRLLRGHQREANYELWENTCHEGERDVDNILITQNAGKDKQAKSTK